MLLAVSCNSFCDQNPGVRCTGQLGDGCQGSNVSGITIATNCCEGSCVNSVCCEPLGEPCSKSADCCTLPGVTRSCEDGVCGQCSLSGFACLLDGGGCCPGLACDLASGLCGPSDAGPDAGQPTCGGAVCSDGSACVFDECVPMGSSGGSSGGSGSEGFSGSSGGVTEGSSSGGSTSPGSSSGGSATGSESSGNVSGSSSGGSAQCLPPGSYCADGGEPCCSGAVCQGNGCLIVDGGFCDAYRHCAQGLNCYGEASGQVEGICQPPCARASDEGGPDSGIACCPGTTAIGGFCGGAYYGAPCTSQSYVCGPGLYCDVSETLCVNGGTQCNATCGELCCSGECPNSAQCCEGTTCVDSADPTCSEAGWGCSASQPCCAGSSCAIPSGQNRGVCGLPTGSACTLNLDCASGGCDPVHGVCCNGVGASCGQASDCCGSGYADPIVGCDAGVCCFASGQPCPEGDSPFAACCSGYCNVNGQCS